MSFKKKYSDYKRKKIYQLRSSGLSFGEIAKKMRMKKGSVKNLYYIYKKSIGGAPGSNLQNGQIQETEVPKTPDRAESVKGTPGTEIEGSSPSPLVNEALGAIEKGTATPKKEARAISKIYKDKPLVPLPAVTSKKIPGEVLKAGTSQEDIKFSSDPRLVDFEGVEMIFIDIIDSRLIDKGVKPLTSKEKLRLTKAWVAFVKRRIHLLWEYADVINLALAILIPLIPRAIKNKKPKEPPLPTAKPAPPIPKKVTETDAERAMREFHEAQVGSTDENLHL